MSAGEFFDLIRPAVLIVSALVSTLVLANARRNFPLFLAMLWALATLFFPLITVPLYLVVQLVRKRHEITPHTLNNTSTRVQRAAPSWLVTTPLAYATVVLSLIGVYLYTDHQSIDAHLARAAQAKLKGEFGQSIIEYRRALLDDDNPHTHKLLAIELADVGNWTEALMEFRLAEEGGEPDDSIPFRIGSLLDILNLEGQARLEYQRYLVTRACTDPVPDGRCVIARAKVQPPLD
jgi:tetratricopeptide (TPR) repeat protein